MDDFTSICIIRLDSRPRRRLSVQFPVMTNLLHAESSHSPVTKHTRNRPCYASVYTRNSACGSDVNEIQLPKYLHDIRCSI